MMWECSNCVGCHCNYFYEAVLTHSKSFQWPWSSSPLQQTKLDPKHKAKKGNLPKYELSQAGKLGVEAHAQVLLYFQVPQ